MVSKYSRAIRKGSLRAGTSDTPDNCDSIATENLASVGYAPNDYPGDSYYTLQQIYREYVKSGKIRRRSKLNRLRSH